jgi:uncharacterized membrane protein YhaH (DUF805 family)
MNWYLKVLKQYADFTGRARRTEYWMFFLFNFLFAIAATILDNLVGTAIDNVGYGLFYIVYALATFIPGIAVCVRRLHDVGKSGAYIFIAFIPLVGAILLIVKLVQNSQEGDNQYGANPKLEVTPTL